MERTVYNRREWRNLPRDYCIVDELLGAAAGPCKGLIHHHHVDPTDPDSRTVQCCAAHHATVHKVLRGLSRQRRRCTHNHRYEHARRDCEARLNRN